jgi:hypothetical protein
MNGRICLANSETIGLIHRSNDNVRNYLAANPDVTVAVLQHVYDEDVRGEALIADTKPDYAAGIRASRSAFLKGPGCLAVQTDYLTEVQERFLQTDWVAHEILQKPGREISARVAATAIEFGLTVLSGNKFFLRVADEFPLVGGVYDLWRAAWIVPPANHLH